MNESPARREVTYIGTEPPRKQRRTTPQIKVQSQAPFRFEPSTRAELEEAEMSWLGWHLNSDDGTARLHLRATAYFRNSAITLAVSRDARACHQVRHKTPTSETDSTATTIFFAARTRSKSTKAQKIKCVSMAGSTSPSCHNPANTESTCPPFQGRGTGSNPFGGAREFR